ncbi:MAG: DUF2793 domain-containing protein [Roseovarius sp.]|nr:DUF2793 domain-containing protein [Roseovarius sp.]
MQDQSSILSLPFILPAQAQKHVTHNEALGILDILVQLAVSDRALSAPPANPAEGERHIVANGAVGEWAGAERQIATWTDGNWRFIEPRPGWRAEVLSEERSVVFDGTAWVERLPDLDNLAGVGVGTAADAVNRLAVASPATLLTHEGAGHQLKLNKAAQGDTASLLFQTNWSGRAEMGTAGADDWSIKVSADGATWTEALRVAGASGLVSGAAVQSSADDTTAGRLMRADFGYSRGNILGTVSRSGGVPTGAIIERGSNANGSYTRFADGTQICMFEAPAVTTTVAAGALFQEGNFFQWTYPASFVAPPRVSGSGGSTSRWLAIGQPSIAAAGYRIFSWLSNSNPGPPQLIAVGHWF